MSAPAGSLVDPTVQQCPYPHYDRMRAENPIQFDSGLGAYIVTSHELAIKVLGDFRTFSNIPQSARGVALVVDPRVMAILKEKGFGRFRPTVVNNDPPSHARYRKLLNAAFKPSRIRTMETYIDEIVEALGADLPESGAIDIVSRFAIPLPLYIIADQLGIPRSDYPQFKLWSDAWLISMGLGSASDDVEVAANRVVEMQHYMIERIRSKREIPTDDILSDLAAAELEEPDGSLRLLTDLEILSMIEQVLIAGNESTTSAIGSGLMMIASDKPLQDRLRNDPASMAPFVEECLRLESPIQGLFRHVTNDIELGGVSLSKGDVVMVRYAAANRDSAKFSDASDVRLDRGRNDHIAFGAGVHFCVGQQLARAELVASFRYFLDRFSDIVLAIERTEIPYAPSLALRGPQSLPLLLTA